MAAELKKEVQDEFLRLYASGICIAQAAKRVGITASTGITLLARRGIKRNDTFQSIRAQNWERLQTIKRLREKGLNPKDIAEVLEVSIATIANMLNPKYEERLKRYIEGEGLPAQSRSEKSRIEVPKFDQHGADIAPTLVGWGCSDIQDKADFIEAYLPENWQLAFVFGINRAVIKNHKKEKVAAYYVFDKVEPMTVYIY